MRRDRLSVDWVGTSAVMTAVLQWGGLGTQARNGLLDGTWVRVGSRRQCSFLDNREDSSGGGGGVGCLAAPFRTGPGRVISPREGRCHVHSNTGAGRVDGRGCRT